MPILQLEHRIKDFALWKAAFDRDPIDRRGAAAPALAGDAQTRIVDAVEDVAY